MPKFAAALALAQLTAPAAPPAGYSLLYPDSGGTPRLADATGTHTLVTDSELPDRAAVYAPAIPPPRPPQPASVVTLFASGHGWTGTGTGATFNLNDTTDVDSGLQSAKATTGGTGAQTNLRRFAGTIPDTTGRAVRLRIKVDNTTHLNELDFYLGTSSLANNYKWSFFIQGGSRYLPDGEWCTVTLSFASATTTGTVSRSGLTDAQLQIWDDAAGAVTVHIQSVELIPDGSSEFPNGVASICFDDSWDSPKTVSSGTYTAWSKLDSLGWPATMYVITDMLGQANRLTLTDLKNRHDRWGWEIAGHAYTDAAHSATYTGLTAAALDADRRAQKAWLLANGFRDGDGSAYPLGQWGTTTDAAATRDYSRRYFAYERTTASRVMETYPPADPMRLRAFSGISTFTGGITPTSLTTASTGTIAKAAANAGWLILVFHKMVTASPASTSDVLIADFVSIMDSVAAAGMDVATVGDVLTRRGAVL